MKPGSSTKDTNATNYRIAQITNEANRAIAEQTNMANAVNTQNTNAANIQMNTENNLLQQKLQNQMNEFNSVGAQLERARQAGVNPNAVIQGTLSGNTQNTLPSMTAGHADSPIAQIGAPMQAVTMENPYAEKIATINTMNQIANDFVNRKKAMQETESVRQGTISQAIDNTYKDNLNALQVAISRGQAKQIEETIGYIQTQNETLREQQNVFKANIAMMNEQRIGQFLDNYFRVDSQNSFIEATKARFREEGIPEEQWVNDETIKAYYYGQITDNDLKISQTQLNQIKQNETKANTSLIEQTKKFTQARTKGQILENYIYGKYGEQQTIAQIENTKQDTENKKATTPQINANTENTKADTKNKQQQNRANRYMESRIYQGYLIENMARQNAKLQSDIEESKTRQAKNVAETVESVTRSGKNLIDIAKPF